MVLFGFQFYPVCNFGKLSNFGFDTVRIERVNEALCCVPGKRYVSRDRRKH